MIIKRLKEARIILVDLGLPTQQQNDRTALCLLCLLNISPKQNFNKAQATLRGITPIMNWAREHYNKEYAPNSRETFRRFSMHQLIEAGICLLNPDDLKRPINSPHNVYQIEPTTLALLKTYGTAEYKINLVKYLSLKPTLIARYAKERDMLLVPVKINNNKYINISAGEHSELIKLIIEKFAPRFVPNGQLIYVGDTGDKHGYFDVEALKQLQVILDEHGKFPDVIIYHTDQNWLILIESVTSHGPVDSKRHAELEGLFKPCTAGLVYVSAFNNKKCFLKYTESISWETEVWIADNPSHMIHFNGSRFLGPYKK